jgi:uncharacterized protein YbjT (DUF2867 family)
MRILVTGASGFVGSELIPRLVSDGHTLHVSSRDGARVHSALAHSQDLDLTNIEVLPADILTGKGLSRALEGVEVAYYLIHSMESSKKGSFSERERRGAQNFAAAAKAASVRRIVYLGGLVPSEDPVSRHLASRQEVEHILLDAVADSVALRASIVIGARSRSFRFLVHLVERLPVLALPAWRKFHTQPIDARDVIEILASAHSAPALSGRTLDIAGPDVLSYEQMICRISELMLLRRPPLRLAVNMTSLAARVAAAIAGEQPELILPLMEGLQGDLLPDDDHVAQLLGVDLHSFDSAVERALRDWEMVEPLAAR